VEGDAVETLVLVALGDAGQVEDLDDLALGDGGIAWEAPGEAGLADDEEIAGAGDLDQAQRLAEDDVGEGVDEDPAGGVAGGGGWTEGQQQGLETVREKRGGGSCVRVGGLISNPIAHKS